MNWILVFDPGSHAEGLFPPCGNTLGAPKACKAAFCLELSSEDTSSTLLAHCTFWPLAVKLESKT